MTQLSPHCGRILQTTGFIKPTSTNIKELLSINNDDFKIIIGLFTEHGLIIDDLPNLMAGEVK